MKQPTNMEDHVLVPGSVAAFSSPVYPGVKHSPCSSEYAPMFYHKFIKMSIKYMDFEGHPAVCCATVLHQSLNQLHMALWSPEPWWQSCSIPLSPSSELPGELLAFHDLLYLSSNKDTKFDFCQLRKEVLMVLEGTESLSRAVTDCFIRPSLMHSGVISTSRGPPMFLPTVNCCLW